MAQAEPQVDARFTQRSRAHWQTPTHLRTSHTLALVSPLQTIPRSSQPLSPTRSPSSSLLIQSCVHSCSRRAPLFRPVLVSRIFLRLSLSLSLPLLMLFAFLLLFLLFFHLIFLLDPLSRQRTIMSRLALSNGALAWRFYARHVVVSRENASSQLEFGAIAFVMTVRIFS